MLASFCYNPKMAEVYSRGTPFHSHYLSRVYAKKKKEKRIQHRMSKSGTEEKRDKMMTRAEFGI